MRGARSSAVDRGNRTSLWALSPRQQYGHSRGPQPFRHCTVACYRTIPYRTSVRDRIVLKKRKREAGMSVRTMLALSGVAAMALVPAPVRAQQPAQPAASGESSGLEEVVVTARRREERLQTVPIGITVLN